MKRILIIGSKKGGIISTYISKGVILVYCVNKISGKKWALAYSFEVNTVEYFNQLDTSLSPEQFKRQTGLSIDEIKSAVNPYAKRIIEASIANAYKLALTSGPAAFLYARDVIKRRFPEGEILIASNAESSYHYANDVIEGRWLPGEAIIATSAQYAYLYAHYIIKGRWPSGEAAIATHHIFTRDYKKFLKSLAAKSIQNV